MSKKNAEVNQKNVERGSRKRRDPQTLYVIIFVLCILFVIILIPLIGFRHLPERNHIRSTEAPQLSMNDYVATAQEQSVEQTAVAATEIAESVKPLILNQEIKIEDYARLTFQYVNFRTKVVPPSISGAYSYYEVKNPGSTYFEMIFSVYNQSPQNLRVTDVVDGTAIYDSKYEYTCFSAAEEDNGSDLSSYASISPLTETRVHVLCEVPLEVQTSGKSVQFRANIKNEPGSYLFTYDSNNAEDYNPMKEWENYPKLTRNSPLNISDYGRLTVTGANFRDRVDPPSKGNKTFTSYYEVEDPKMTYAHLIMSFYNSTGKGKDADKVATVKVIYDNNYEYRCFSTIEEDNGTDFTYTNITDIDPLTTGVIHYLCTVPDEVGSSGKPVVFVVNFNGTNYSYQVR